MVKVKNKRNSGLADKVHAKRKSDALTKKINPFEVHINREKIKVLGKKSKHDRGLPGVSRAKAIQKRKETLGTEMKLMHKTNAFIDRRIGEKDNQLSSEDRIIARFAAERAKQHTKKNIYNLADDEILTHRGQTLEQIEKFDDPRSSDEDDDDRRKFGGLDNDFVAEGHFGGGVLSKTDAKDGAKSHKDLIEQLIAESKKRKAEKQKEKEQTLDLTEKLDTEWKDLQPVVLKKCRVEEESPIDKLLNKVERNSLDYDKMMRELRFEKRGTPSDGLVSEEKREKEEQKKLEQLERERQQRMLGDGESGTARAVPTAGNHRSAEDLDDGFELEDQQDFMLAYDKDGNPLVPDHIFKANSVPNSKKQFNDGISDSSDDESSGEEESDSDDPADDDDSIRPIVDDEPLNNVLIEEENQETVDKEPSESGDSTNSEQSEDHKEAVDEELGKKVISKDEVQKSKPTDDKNKEVKIKANKRPTSDVIEIEVKSKTRKISGKSNGEIEEGKNGLFQLDDVNQSGDDSEGDESEEESQDGAKKNDFSDLKDLKDDQSSDDDENEVNDDVESCDEDVESCDDGEKIGSFFDQSDEGDNLKELLSGKTPAQQSVALEKLIKSYDPSLGENNKDLLSKIFAHLLQYINDLFSNLKQEGDVIKSFLVFNKIVPHLYDLAQTNKVSSKKYINEVLKEKYDDFKKNTKRAPDLDTLIFFKLISLIYPTSDFRHPVTTPAFVFMSEILTKCRFRDAYSVSRGLFITALVLEYTVLSKRLVPSAINFLRGILYLGANTSILNPIQVVPPFRLHKDVKFLNLEDDCSKLTVGNKMAVKDLVLKEVDNDFKIRCLNTSVGMLKELFDNANDIEAQECIFESHIRLLGRIDVDLYPKKVAKQVGEVLNYMKSSLEVKTYTPLAREKKRPKALRMYEPDVQEVFTGSKNWKQSREQVERDKLKHKLKKEMKGALREIRRDKAYIASVKIKEKIHSDNIRKEKVKQIYKDASIQQGELNKLKRMK